MPKTYVFTAYGGPETQQFMDLPRPVPGEGELLVRVRAAGVNPADVKRREGRVGRYAATEPLRAPQPMGIEASGVVEAVGAGTEGFSVGDEVFGFAVGSWSEYVLLHVSRSAHKPGLVSFVDAATLSVAAAAAYDGVRQLQLKPDETLLVVGVGGGVGIAVAQIALAEGTQVLGTASASKKNFVESLGVTHVASGDGVADRVRAAAPQGIDALYDLVGGDALREVAALVRDGSRIITAADADVAEEFGGSQVKRTPHPPVLKALAELVAVGKVKPCVTATFPLERAGEALHLVESGHATGKIVLEMS